MGHEQMEKQEKERIYAHALYRTPGLGRAAALNLCRRAGGCEAAYGLSESELRDMGLGKSVTERLMRARESGDPVRDYIGLKEKGISVIPYNDPDYPGRLRGIPDLPFILYCRGRLPADDRPAVALIGARLCSEYGRLLARDFGKGLAESGIQVVSGMARGVDGIGQRAALRAGGSSFAVLGCGVDICYPEENRELYDELADSGGLLSEWIPGTMPEARLFPPRNRIISGLSDAVLVVEARQRSGTLITVDMALEQGKEVFAVPGRITDRLSDGCMSLIRQGAVMALDVQDITDYFRERGMMLRGLAGRAVQGQEAGCEAKEQDPGNETTGDDTADGLSELQKLLLYRLDIDPRPVSDLCGLLEKDGAAYSVSEVMNALVELTLTGSAVRSAGGFSGRHDLRDHSS